MVLNSSKVRTHTLHQLFGSIYSFIRDKFSVLLLRCSLFQYSRYILACNA